MRKRYQILRIAEAVQCPNVARRVVELRFHVGRRRARHTYGRSRRVGGTEQGCVQTTHEASSLTPPFAACIRAYGPMNHFLLPPFAAFVLPATVLRSNRHAMRSRCDESRSDRRQQREQNEQTYVVTVTTAAD